jgi:hypothetical protein
MSVLRAKELPEITRRGTRSRLDEMVDEVEAGAPDWVGFGTDWYAPTSMQALASRINSDQVPKIPAAFFEATTRTDVDGNRVLWVRRRFEP